MFSQEELMETQWDLVMANFKDQKTAGLVRENLADMSSGSSPYRADVLRLGLNKAFELKKKKTRAPVPPVPPAPPAPVQLQCSASDCAWHSTQKWKLSSIGSDLFCHLCIAQGRSNVNYYQCTGCGFNRTGNHASCQGCGAMFVN